MKGIGATVLLQSIWQDFEDFDVNKLKYIINKLVPGSKSDPDQSAYTLTGRLIP